ncbi:Pvc16 family protein [Methanosarcina sp.]|uniref:Pvc16 family protein n=1 Tax=Methanosarcina sp. TaxID=2213 RepID=UPI002989289A|nr:Pvc16 family protein [Methanosarcina sp.]MDW5549441.1 Pvc16 family protein [Methanosarcina sp.]MDW5553368.1 Pvc16 family protein [Methanosarcina sp.]MDW5559692.1 Pvc16 family protein [Methanosarcina sp.]
MIEDLSKTLKEIFGDKNSTVPDPLKSAEIVFDRPDNNFAPTVNTVDLFLYDIRENVELRSNEPRIERKCGQAIIHHPSLRVACSYLITAWPAGGTDLPLKEHQLLGQILTVLSKYPTIPEDFLQGSLKGQEPPLPMIIAQTECFKNPAEFWTAVGNKVRPSLTVTVTFSLEILSPEDAPLVITNLITMGQRISPEDTKISPATREESFSIGGCVTSNNAPVKNVTVTLVELDIKTKTGVDGHYTLGPMNSGTYTLCLSLDDKVLNKSIIVPASDKIANGNYDINY